MESGSLVCRRTVLAERGTSGTEPLKAALSGSYRPRVCKNAASQWSMSNDPYRLALLFSFRKLAMVLKSGINRPVSHISSTLR